MEQALNLNKSLIEQQRKLEIEELKNMIKANKVNDILLSREN